jgi:hypothetical protein
VGPLGTLGTVGHRVVLLGIAAALLAGSVAVGAQDRPDPVPFPLPRAAVGSVTRALSIPAPPTAAGLDLRAGPVTTPLELRIPTLGVDARVLGVGLLGNGVMDAPQGPVDDPAWDQAFWYRGSAVPGALSTALVAGHIDGPGGRPAVFGNLDRLVPGDPIIVHDTRTGIDVQFSVSGSERYSLEQTTDPAVLTRIYGRGPVVGAWPEPAPDRLAHLTLITCAGTFRDGTHDHRLAVFAVRTA